MNKLIEKAKNRNFKKRARIYTQDEMDLAYAWATGEITYSQVGHAMGFSVEKNPQSCYLFLSRALKQKLSK